MMMRTRIWLVLSITGVGATYFFGIAFKSWRGQLFDVGVINVDYSNLVVAARPSAEAALRAVFSKNVRVRNDCNLRLGTVSEPSRNFAERHDYCFHFPNKQSGGEPLWIRVRLRDGAVWIDM